MPPWLEAFLTYTLTPSPAIFAIGTIIIIFAPILLHILIVSSTPYTTLPRVLLFGPTDGGKTALATLLERGPSLGPAETQTSQVPLTIGLTAARGEGWEDAGKDTFSDDKSDDGSGGSVGSSTGHTKFLLVDVPGHPKLRIRATARLVPSSVDAERVQAIVFVVDAAALGERETLSDSAAFLYDVLLALQRRALASKTSKHPRSIPVLIAANKADLFTALPAAATKAALEAEITRIRASRSRGLLDSGVGVDDIGSGEQDVWLGRWGSEKFNMSQMRELDIDVTVLDGCVKGEGGPRIDDWWAWVAARV